MKNNDMFLIGVDLVKNEKILEQAYNDSQGVTAKFNLNMLSRINEELGGNFDLSLFAHRAKYNKTEARIEMYLESLCEQSVTIPDANLLLNFTRGELITTEHSHKFSILKIKSLLEDTGFKINNVWLDEDKYFGLILASKIN